MHVKKNFNDKKILKSYVKSLRAVVVQYILTFAPIYTNFEGERAPKNRRWQKQRLFSALGELE